MAKPSVYRQLQLLKVPKSSYYYQPHRNIERVYQDEVIKDEIMEIYKEYPFYGVPRATQLLQQMGYNINHKRVNRLRRAMGLKTTYPRPRFRTSEPCEEHKKYPYLLKGLKINVAGQSKCTTCGRLKMHHPLTFNLSSFYSLSNAFSF